MAKKKTTAADTTQPAKKASKSKKTEQPAAGGAAPLINTAQAAANAARMLAARAKLSAAQSTGKGPHLATQVKNSLNKAPSATVGSALGNAFGEHRSNLPHQPGKQVVHNQASGVGRFSVPRRSNG